MNEYRYIKGQLYKIMVLKLTLTKLSKLLLYSELVKFISAISYGLRMKSQDVKICMFKNRSFQELIEANLKCVVDEA